MAKRYSNFWALMGFYLLIVVIILGVRALVATSYQITENKVRPQLERVLGVSQYKIIDASNNNLLFGTPGEVTYNIQLPDGTVVSCLCTDGLFQPRICRKYQ